MPLSTLTPGNEKQDEKLNPGQGDYDSKFNNLANAENTGTFNDIMSNEGFPDSFGDELSSNDNSAAGIRNQESEGTKQIAPWVDGTSEKDVTKNAGKTTLKGVFKKKGPLVGILGILGIGGVGASILFSPAMLLVHMKETLTDKFNVQLSSLDVRSARVISNQLSDKATDGICSGALNVRCRFNSMSKRQMSRLDKAGIKAFDKNGTPLKANSLGRGRPASIEIDGKKLNASDLRKEMRRNPSLRSAYNRVYNPKFTAFSDSVSKKVNTKLKISKKNNLVGATDKEGLNKKLRSTVSGDDFSIKNDPNIKITEDGEYIDESTDPHTKLSKEEYEARKKSLSDFDAESNARKDASKMGSKLTKLSLKGALTSTALGAGAVDSVCTGYQMIRAAGFAAKYIGMLQLSRYAMTFMTTADAIKAGEATPEQVEYLGNILTSTNSEGKSATDSYGYKFAAYGETGGMPKISNAINSEEEAILADEVLRYTNGQLVDKNTLTDIIKLIDNGGGSTDSADKACGFVKSGWGQTILIGTAVLGVGVAVFTGGVSLGWGAALQATASISLSIAVVMLSPKLAEMATGTLVTGDENGNQAGNAIVSGMGGYNAQLAQGRGLAVLTKEDAVAYQNLTNETLALYSEADRVESSPFDITNKNTFVGSVASQLIAHAPRDIPSITNSVIKSLSSIPASIASKTTAKAASVDDFSKCNDTEYSDRNLAADPFCNLQYGMKPSSLNIDPNTVLDSLINGGHIDEVSGEPTSDRFKEFIEYCVDRESPIGGYREGESGDLEGESGDLAYGYACVDGGGEDKETNDLYTNFRLYLIDKSIVDELDGTTPGDSSSQTATEDGSPVNLPDGTEPELSKIILDSGNVVDSTGQLSQIINGSRTNVSSDILRVIAGLSESNKFRISSMKRDAALGVGAGNRSLHLVGRAVDISGSTGVNGVSFGYSGHNQVVQDFINSAVSAMPAGCQVGVPNQTYVNKVREKYGRKCIVFVDLGSAPHIHLAIGNS